MEEKKKREDMMLKGVICRICAGEHFTMHCPSPPNLPPPPEPSVSTKYVPPSRRGVETMSVEKTACLRVSCISDQLTEEELYLRFTRFGKIARIFLPRNYVTGKGKGYGYVSFVRRKDAARAMEVMDRRGFDNLIMRVAWDERNLLSNSSTKSNVRGRI